MVFESIKNKNLMVVDVNLELNGNRREEYLSLLNRKMRLEKEAEHYEWRYIQLFGKQIEKLLELQTECIKYKKIIAIYYRMLNNGQKFSRDKALIELAIELKPYYDYIDYIKTIKNDKGEKVSDFHITNIKKMYKKIVNCIHPDINPQLYDNEKIQELWNLATQFYKCNNFEKLQETYVLIMDELDELNIDIDKIIEIENINVKIEKVKREIDDILNSDPYLYNLILEDNEMIKEKKEQLQVEIQEYQNYSNELQNELKYLGIDINDYNIV